MALVSRPWLIALASIASGALLPLGMAPFNVWPVAILSCVFLNLLILHSPVKRVFIRCLGFGLGMFGVGVYWVFISMYVHGGEPLATALLLTTLFIALLATIFAASFSLFGLLGSKYTLLNCLAFPACWLWVEWLRGWLFTGFPWLYLGNSFIDTWLAGWAPLGGVLLLSFIGALTASALVQLLKSVSPSSQSIQRTGLIVAAVAALWLVAAPLKSIQWTTPKLPALTLAMVQPALTPSQKWNSDILYDILVQMRQQSADYWYVDLMIWPESAIPVPPQDIAPYMDFLDTIATDTNTTLITGIPRYQQGRYYNSLMLLGEEEGYYSKQHLVPFGEYVPFETLVRGLFQFFDLPMSSFSRGSANQPLLTSHNVLLASAICYEIAYQDHVADYAKDANIILTLSNDVWFSDSIAPHQHLQMARMRAIENRKPVVRSTNNGISAVIDHHGVITHQLPSFIAATLAGDVVATSGQTPFNYWRSWPVILLSLLIIVLSMKWHCFSANRCFSRNKYKNDKG